MAVAGMEQAPFVRTAGESGQLWDVWQSAAYVDALDGWLGLVYKSADGFHGQDPDRTLPALTERRLRGRRSLSA
jgi:hypothetical protein